jgi:hypothetical protein
MRNESATKKGVTKKRNPSILVVMGGIDSNLPMVDSHPFGALSLRSRRPKR